MRVWLAVGSALAAAFASPCFAERLEVVVPPAVSPAPLPAGAKARPVSLARIAANIAPGTLWVEEAVVESPVPLPCGVDPAPLTSRWKESDNRVEHMETWDRVMRQELKAAGFSTGGDPTNLFEEQQGSDLQLGALITDVRARECALSTLGGDTFGGSAVMSVEWQVYSVALGKVVAKIQTRGGTVLKQSKDGTQLALITGAFGDNVRRLAAEPVFRELVLASRSAEPNAAPALPISVKQGSAADRVPISAAVQSVVTIYAADGAGSGVVVSADGYILTNHHVAGSGGQVRVRWADGAESVGDVVRADSRRDVALIRVPPRVGALPIRHTPVAIGETVFAIGTPLRDEFANTLTRGVISGTRRLDGLSMIQSDVAVDHGNSGGPLLDEQGRIVALTVAVYAPDDVSHNINFFIPIDDALHALTLEVSAPDQAAAQAGTSAGKRSTRSKR